MPTLTRRRSHDSHREVWLVFYGDIPVGTIGERAGVSIGAQNWLSARKIAHCLIENVTEGFRADDWGGATESGRWRQWRAGSAWAHGARCWRRWLSATGRQVE